jgi:hypothetical protein
MVDGDDFRALRSVNTDAPDVPTASAANCTFLFGSLLFRTGGLHIIRMHLRPNDA